MNLPQDFIEDSNKLFARCGKSNLRTFSEAFWIAAEHVFNGMDKNDAVNLIAPRDTMPSENDDAVFDVWRAREQGALSGALQATGYIKHTKKED